MFLGEYEHTVDEKGRLAIPAKFRAGLAEGLVLTRGFDQNLLLYPMPVWRELAARINALPITQPSARNLRRLMFAGASDLGLDKQGRIVLPPNLRQYATITNQAVVTGMDSFIEIWSAERWQTVLDSFADEAPALAEHVSAFGI
ncbi:MAG TPA: transcriptional regulator MraZ [Herpetosiphon sp.]|uniref:Transcriptional regulator MraZ n=1 Tax=Herpetosiphon aurantiacus (strain ATCC 23779 / DSM 785 / 114-95) TaxID=316274 RepID=MRAZ_HERA2|nr:division/cell wall cluster transcriptional repressor MraZ [Herpetosiphon sp.]A9B519.1 RecName: Full=Transcriptional regulator MraZ [Herpetosiphon aurantiacus DSM 785]ABX06156.1 MraZ protein [Herpetosiphon aurantiacus DSM 785]MCA0353435.1 division/cell wall cluster transcriptional repressor MraZ [Chloroflexota bacterium]HBW51346.1 transcriptional regulator MraZ [Herpetosiphon sp.]